MAFKVKESLARVIAKSSYKEAEKNANTTASFIHGQPKMPESVKRLKNKNV